MGRKPIAENVVPHEPANRTKRSNSSKRTGSNAATQEHSQKSGSKKRAPRTLDGPAAISAQPSPIVAGAAVRAKIGASTFEFVPKSRWPLLFVATLSSLIVLGFGLWATELVENLFNRHPILGWLGSALLALTGLALFAMVLSELFGIWRLRKLTALQTETASLVDETAKPDIRTLDRIVALYENRADMQWHISNLASHADDIMDTRDRMLLAERYLMAPLDTQAKRIISGTAQRVSILTAVNPTAGLDVLFVSWQVLRMLRQITALYGCRSGSLGTLRLARMVGSHLAITGGLALSDTLLQQFLGKGLAGKLSAKLGEGTVNGILTARIGIAAMDLCRPMPFVSEPKPGLREFLNLAANTFGKRNDQDEVS